ncbi:MAG TPA: hypothetical protein VG496_12310 [Myxococcales bacterium]|nr:hypothetical protein [Myxococcales bacterium]
MTGIAFVVAVISIVLAVVFHLQGRSAAEAVAALKTETDSARKAADEARAQLREAQADVKARSAQIVELREKVNDLRKRSQEKVQPRRGAREAELEEDLTHARRLVEEAHAAEQQARKDAATATAEAAALRTELERVKAAAQKPSPETRPEPVDDTKLRESEERRQAVEKALKESETALRQTREKERAAREELKKARGRAETNNRVYLVTKGELEIVRERLAQAEKALWKAGLPVPAPPRRERPRATGPAAATHELESSETNASPRPDPTPAEPPSAGVEPVSAAASQPNGVEVRSSAGSDGEPAH